MSMSNTEKTVKDIRRNTRRKFSTEEKIRIVLDGLRGESSVAELCRREGINPNLYYRWSKDFLEAGKKRLSGDTVREANVAANGLEHLGCMAHARRRFNDAVKGQGKSKRTGKAHQGLAWIQKLYRIEKQAKAQALSPAERKLLRHQQAKPILDKLRAWLDDGLPSVPPSTLLGKAMHYLNNEWPRLVRYLDDGRLEIDNNLAENAIRPFVVGRKNWLFSDSVKGVQGSAGLYSLIETAKANGLEPYQYLRQVFTALPQAETVEAVECLLPWRVKKISAETS